MTQTGLPLQTSGFRIYTGVLVSVRLESLKFTGSPESCRLLSWSCMIALSHGPVFFDNFYLAYTPPFLSMITSEVRNIRKSQFDSFFRIMELLFF